ncbi:MAG TPA: carboxylesterase family protein, partial [Atopostipes sp.]|nr:carboxylesterase family protein [Atopostipes sp.]
PEIAIAKGVGKDIPVLIGTNKDEYRLFTFFDPTWEQIDEAGMVHRLNKMLGPLWQGIEAHVMNQRLDRNLFEKVMSFQIFTFPAVRLAEQQVRYGSLVWMYRFDWESPVFEGGLKATHAMEIPFVWNNINKPGMENLIGDSPDQNIANQMNQSWIAFARNGSPNTPILPDWEPYSKGTRPTMLFNVESKVANDPDKEERLIWKNASDV